MVIILLATVITMPKLINQISFVVFLNAADFAITNILESCAFNILIISTMDLFYDQKKLTSVAQTGAIIVVSFGAILGAWSLLLF